MMFHLIKFQRQVSTTLKYFSVDKLYYEAIANSYMVEISNKYSILDDQLSITEEEWTLFQVLIAEIAGKQLIRIKEQHCNTDDTIKLWESKKGVL